MDRHEAVRQFIRRHLPNLVKAQQLGDDDDIFRLGYVNSLFAMQILMFVEREFACVVENDEMEVSNFNSVNHIVAFVDRKRSQQSVVGTP